MAPAHDRAFAESPSRAELLAALSVAIDLGLGQPSEHMLRAALIGTRIADSLGLDRVQRDCTYYTNLVMWIGCHADSHEYAQWFGVGSKNAISSQRLTVNTGSIAGRFRCCFHDPDGERLTECRDWPTELSR